MKRDPAKYKQLWFTINRDLADEFIAFIEKAGIMKYRAAEEAISDYLKKKEQ